MRRRRDLQLKLDDRYQRLLARSPDGFAQEIRLAVAWIAKQRVLVYTLEEARSRETPPNSDTWINEASGQASWDWPTDTYAGRAVFIWDLLRRVSVSDDQIWTAIFKLFRSSEKPHKVARNFAEQVIQHLFDYLGDQVRDGSCILYTLERYVRQTEWFDRPRLHAEFMKSRQGENVYDCHLREFLFREGFNMPYSQQRSPSGLSDIILDLESDDPLICELKVYDGVNRDIAHLSSGVTQARQYALDHGKHIGHLVIVNMARRPLVLPTDDPENETPAYIDVADVRIYLILVRGLPQESASKQGKTEPLTVRRTMLVSDDS